MKLELFFSLIGYLLLLVLFLTDALTVRFLFGVVTFHVLTEWVCLLQNRN